MQWTESQTVHRCDRSSAHRENVAKNSTYPCRGALERFDEGRMIVRLDFVRNSKPITDIDDAGILARSLKYCRPFCWQAPQVHTRTFVAAVLAPHDAENAELCQTRFAFQNVDDLMIFSLRQSMLGEKFVCNYHRSFMVL